MSESDQILTDVEYGGTKPGEPILSFSSFSFFGVPFKVGFDLPLSAEIYRNTYGSLSKNSEYEGVKNKITFKVYSKSENSNPAIFIENGEIDHLIDVLKRGSNRFRFKIKEPAPDAESYYQVSDAFLDDKLVMLVGKRVCFFLDHERWQAYAESIIFHTVLSHIPDHFLMHAGVVSQGDSAVILCGEANRGKTTMTLALVREGFKFLSDEVAFIEKKKARVHPFPRALGLREKTIGMFSELNRSELQPTKSLSGDDKWLVDINSIYPGSQGGPCNIGAIVFMEGFSQTTQLKPLTSSEALLECMKFSHTAENNPFLSMLAVADVVQSARCYRLFSGSVNETVRIVAESIKR